MTIRELSEVLSLVGGESTGFTRGAENAALEIAGQKTHDAVVRFRPLPDISTIRIFSHPCLSGAVNPYSIQRNLGLFAHL